MRSDAMYCGVPKTSPVPAEPRVLLRQRDAEVEQLDHVAARDLPEEDVLGLQVAVDDAEVMGAGDAACHLPP